MLCTNTPKRQSAPEQTLGGHGVATRMGMCPPTKPFDSMSFKEDARLARPSKSLLRSNMPEGPGQWGEGQAGKGEDRTGFNEIIFLLLAFGQECADCKLDGQPRPCPDLAAFHSCIPVLGCFDTLAATLSLPRPTWRVFQQHMQCHEVGSRGHDLAFIAFHIHLQGTRGVWTLMCSSRIGKVSLRKATNHDVCPWTERPSSCTRPASAPFQCQGSPEP